MGAIENPFASPASGPAGDGGEDLRDDEAAFRRVAWRIVGAWERLRIAYLVWLSVVGLATLWIPGVTGRGSFASVFDGEFVAIIAAGFIGANFCFTAGHALEFLLATLGMRAAARGWVRVVVFVLGSLFAAGLTVGVVLVAAGW
ncbi:MAG: hypothetical protein AAGJ46_01215 [Planctomycetota bacterium]